LVPFDEKSVFLGLGQIRLFKLRGHPVGRRVRALLLCHLILVSDSLDAHLHKLRSGAPKKLRSAREMKQWWQWKEQGAGKQ
jgi:hypothetical protein